jgi:hypothetical protein
MCVRESRDGRGCRERGVGGDMEAMAVKHRI